MDSLTVKAPGRTVAVRPNADGSVDLTVSAHLPAEVMEAALEYVAAVDAHKRARAGVQGLGRTDDPVYETLRAMDRAKAEIDEIAYIGDYRPEDAMRAAWVIFNTSKEEK